MRPALARGLWAATAATILVLTSWPNPGDLLPPQVLSWDKLAHVALYLPYGLFMALSLRDGAPRWLWGLALAFPVLDEVHQLLIPGRFCSGADILADAAGMAFGIVLARRLP